MNLIISKYQVTVQMENNDDLLIINSNSNQCGCDNNIGRNRVSARINVIPNNNGNTGSICGCYKKKLT